MNPTRSKLFLAEKMKNNLIGIFITVFIIVPIIISFKVYKQYQSKGIGGNIFYFLEDQRDSVLNIRCKDLNKKSWSSTGTKISDSEILLSRHSLEKEFDEEYYKKPYTCNVYSKGTLVSKVSIKDNYRNILDLDLSILTVDFILSGKLIPKITPTAYSTEIGEELYLIGHTNLINNDSIISKGRVLLNDTSKIIGVERKKYWKYSVLTDMVAGPGSSGSPIFNTRGHFIGIHVGGERDKISVNYQIIFNKKIISSILN